MNVSTTSTGAVALGDVKLNGRAWRNAAFKPTCRHKPLNNASPPQGVTGLAVKVAPISSLPSDDVALPNYSNCNYMVTGSVKVSTPADTSGEFGVASRNRGLINGFIWHLN
jgi:hypothetical protein